MLIRTGSLPARIWGTIKKIITAKLTPKSPIKAPKPFHRLIAKTSKIKIIAKKPSSSKR